jgi:protein-S-isoprenylcysteine O-methyltransferase Ste14
MSVLKHVRAVALLPLIVTIIVPAVLLAATDGFRAPGLLLGIAGAVFVACGLLFMAWTITLFVRIGRGTLAPWDPTTRLVVTGPYRHVRNPMIAGVFGVLLGEALIFRSPALFLWFALFVALNAVYIPLSEEPGLVRRFGDDYRRYKGHVPRWLPRLRPWRDLG